MLYLRPVAGAGSLWGFREVGTVQRPLLVERAGRTGPGGHPDTPSQSRGLHRPALHSSGCLFPLPEEVTCRFYLGTFWTRGLTHVCAHVCTHTSVSLVSEVYSSRSLTH